MGRHFHTAAALGLALALPLAACSDGEETAQTVKAPAGPRLVVTAVDTIDWQDVSAEIATVDQAQVMARIPGILTTLSVREGDMVTKGQVIGRVSTASLAIRPALMAHKPPPRRHRPRRHRRNCRACASFTRTAFTPRHGLSRPKQPLQPQRRKYARRRPSRRR